MITDVAEEVTRKEMRKKTSKRKIREIMCHILIVTLVLASTAVCANLGIAYAQADEPSITVIQLNGVPNVDKCKEACPGLGRGSRLSLSLNQPAFAAVYLKSGNLYYLQEGKLAVNGSKTGCTQLWPDGSEPNHKVYALWVVTSKTEIQKTQDDEGLERLPPGRHNGPYKVLWDQSESKKRCE